MTSDRPTAPMLKKVAKQPKRIYILIRELQTLRTRRAREDALHSYMSAVSLGIVDLSEMPAWHPRAGNA